MIFHKCKDIHVTGIQSEKQETSRTLVVSSVPCLVTIIPSRVTAILSSDTTM